MKETLICINCPLGCNLEVTYDKNSIIEVNGNSCKRGEEYAEKEVFHPERIVTTTVRISGAVVPLLPVKTEKSVPKDLSFKIMKCAFGVHVQAPVKVGDIIIENVLDTGVNLVATRDLASINGIKCNRVNYI
jgi:CxxC motif-containing protein